MQEQHSGQTVGEKPFASVVQTPGNMQMISVEQFVARILEEYGTDITDGDVILNGYHSGWLESQDVSGRTHALVRKSAARMIHQFLRCELKEADEIDTGSASKLQDLFECRSCAGHVMQVYTKGIMGGYMDDTARFIFGMNEVVSLEESEDMIHRLFHPEMRKPQGTNCQPADGQAGHEVERITAKEALSYVKMDKNTQLIDVRTLPEFEEKHLEKAVNIPLVCILKNPYMVSERRDVRILLYCSEGYQSEMAARCLVDAGYEKVSYFSRG